MNETPWTVLQMSVVFSIRDFHYGLLDSSYFQPCGSICKPCLQKSINLLFHISDNPFHRHCWKSIRKLSVKFAGQLQLTAILSHIHTYLIYMKPLMEFSVNAINPSMDFAEIRYGRVLLLWILLFLHLDGLNKL